MKKRLVFWIIGMFVIAGIVGGCSAGKAFIPTWTGSDQAMTKQAWEMPKAAPSGVITGSDQGMTKDAWELPKAAPSGVITGSDQGMTKEYVQWPKAK